MDKHVSKSNVMGCDQCCDPNEASMKVSIKKVNPTMTKKLSYTKVIK